MADMLKVFMENVRPGGSVLDLGAGKGEQSEKLVAAGFKVTAVDRDKPEIVSLGVEWISADIRDWSSTLPKDHYDGAHLRNIIQFFKREWVLGELLPRIGESVRAGGIIAIKTFMRAPEPPFPKPHSSYYGVEDLRSAFPGWEALHAKEVERIGPDMSGVERKFYLASIVVKKPL